jgi:putative FmdB family regulatory protein
MPIYEYRCDNGHVFEVMQRMSDDPLTACEQCGAPVHRVFHPVAIHFKGSGFYNTDYGKKNRNSGGKDSETASSSSSNSTEPAASSSKSDTGSTSSSTSSSD